jgi:hypothetical protein
MALQRTRRPRFPSGRSRCSLGSPLDARPFGDILKVTIGTLGLALMVGGQVRADTAQSSAARLAGCYSLSLGPWQPRIPDRDSENELVKLPPRIQLMLSRGKDGWATGKLLVKPAPGAPPGAIADAWWWLTGNRSIAARWTDGFTGMKMKLKGDPHNLRGKVESLWDYQRPKQTRQVIATRIPCDADTSGQAQ